MIAGADFGNKYAVKKVHEKLLTCKAKDRALCYNSFIEQYSAHNLCRHFLCLRVYYITRQRRRELVVCKISVTFCCGGRSNQSVQGSNTSKYFKEAHSYEEVS